MTEAQLQAAVIELAGVLGWWVYHTKDSRRSQPGFPDLVLIRDRIIYRELKNSKRKVTREQTEVGERITLAGGDWAVWRPADWDEDIIFETLNEGGR